MFKSISIIYPVFNEEERLSKTFLDIKKFEKVNKFIKKEYIFVNDGSLDKSLFIINDIYKLDAWESPIIRIFLLSFFKKIWLIFNLSKYFWYSFE